MNKIRKNEGNKQVACGYHLYGMPLNTTGLVQASTPSSDNVVSYESYAKHTITDY